MTIRWDAPLCRGIAEVLDRRLRHARVRALHFDHEGRIVRLHLRDATLIVSLHPERGWLDLFDPREPVEGARPFPGEIQGVEAPADERIVVIRLRRARGSVRHASLALEWIGRRWNAFFTEGGDERIRHVLVSREDGRAPGARYETPSAPARAGREGAIPFEDWEAALGEGGAPTRSALLSSLAWTSAVNADWVLGRHAPGPTGAPDARPGPERSRDGDAASEEEVAGTGAPSLRPIYERWRQLVPPYEGRAGILDPEGRAQPYPVALPPLPWRECADLLEAMHQVASEGEAAPESALIPTRWIEAVEEAVERASKRAERLAEELEGTGDPAATRALGDLILARFREIPRGAGRARLTGFDGTAVEVELDPALPPQESAARYYDRSARMERALERLPRMIEEARAEAEALAVLLAQVRAGEAGIEEIRTALPEAAVREEEAGGAGAEGPALPYRLFRTSGGLEVRVGRGARANDDLTFHHSRPDDVWLHARHVGGAHVVLRWAEEGNPPARDLHEAAMLAALHSKARTSSSVPVDWTRRKYVRKPRKAPPGRVALERHDTLFVDPDPDVAERMRVG